MGDMNKSELLQPGQGRLELGANYAENVGGGSQMYMRGLTEEVKGGGGPLSGLGPEMGGGGGAREEEIRSELRKYEGNWNSKQDAEKDRFAPAWEMVLKAKLGSESAKKWCHDNNLSLEIHGEVFIQLAAKRRAEKMTAAERAQGLTAEFLVFRDALPRLLGNQELVNQRNVPPVQQQGGQNAT